MTPDNLQACSTEAAAAILAGNRLIARLNVENAIGADQNSVETWLLYAWTSDAPSAAELAINRALEIDPDNSLALAGQNWIQGITALATDQAGQEQAELSETVAETEAGLNELMDSISQEEEVVNEAEEQSPEACLPCQAEDVVEADVADDLEEDSSAEGESSNSEAIAGASCEATDEVAETSNQAEAEADCGDELLEAESQFGAKQQDHDLDNVVVEETGIAVHATETDAQAVSDDDSVDDFQADADAQTKVITEGMRRRATAETIVAERFGSLKGEDLKDLLGGVELDQPNPSEPETLSDATADHSSSDPVQPVVEPSATKEEVVAPSVTEAVDTPLVESTPSVESAVEPVTNETLFFADVRNALQQTIKDAATVSDVSNGAEPTDDDEIAGVLPTQTVSRVSAETVEITELLETSSPDTTATDQLPQSSATAELLESQIVEQVSEISEAVSDAVHPVEVPVAEASVEKPINEVPAAEESAQEDLPVVMVVDDSPTIRKLVSMTLSRNGFQVVVANDGVDALKLLSERRPDIILSDINMPRLGGYQLCKFVKKHARTKLIPVLMLSGKDGVFDKMRGKMAGANGYITKPFESADLVHQVRQQLLTTSVS